MSLNNYSTIMGNLISQAQLRFNSTNTLQKKYISQISVEGNAEQIINLQNELRQANASIKEKETQLNTARQEKEQLNQTISEKEQRITQLNSDLTNYQTRYPSDLSAFITGLQYSDADKTFSGRDTGKAWNGPYTISSANTAIENAKKASKATWFKDTTNNVFNVDNSDVQAGINQLTAGQLANHNPVFKNLPEYINKNVGDYLNNTTTLKQAYVDKRYTIPLKDQTINNQVWQQGQFGFSDEHNPYTGTLNNNPFKDMNSAEAIKYSNDQYQTLSQNLLLLINQQIGLINQDYYQNLISVLQLIQEFTPNDTNTVDQSNSNYQRCPDLVATPGSLNSNFVFQNIFGNSQLCLVLRSILEGQYPNEGELNRTIMDYINNTLSSGSYSIKSGFINTSKTEENKYEQYAFFTSIFNSNEFLRSIFDFDLIGQGQSDNQIIPLIENLIYIRSPRTTQLEQYNENVIQLINQITQALQQLIMIGNIFYVIFIALIQYNVFTRGYYQIWQQMQDCIRSNKSQEESVTRQQILELLSSDENLNVLNCVYLCQFIHYQITQIQSAFHYYFVIIMNLLYCDKNLKTQDEKNLPSISSYLQESQKSDVLLDKIVLYLEKLDKLIDLSQLSSIQNTQQPSHSDYSGMLIKLYHDLLLNQSSERIISSKLFDITLSIPETEDSRQTLLAQYYQCLFKYLQVNQAQQNQLTSDNFLTNNQNISDLFYQKFTLLDGENLWSGNPSNNQLSQLTIEQKQTIKIMGQNELYQQLVYQLIIGNNLSNFGEITLMELYYYVLFQQESSQNNKNKITNFITLSNYTIPDINHLQFNNGDKTFTRAQPIPNQVIENQVIQFYIPFTFDQQSFRQVINTLQNDLTSIKPANLESISNENNLFNPNYVLFYETQHVLIKYLPDQLKSQETYMRVPREMYTIPPRNIQQKRRNIYSFNQYYDMTDYMPHPEFL